MPIYTYEAPDTGEIYEIYQKLAEPTLSKHPDTGEELKRIILSAPALHMKGMKKHVQINYKSAAATACGCASNVALAEKMYANTRETPKYGSIDSRKTITNKLMAPSDGKQGSGHSHSSGHKHTKHCNH